MQATITPPRWWWEAERWRRWGARARQGAGDADQLPQLPQLRLHELQRLRDLHALLERQKLALPDILVYTPSRFANMAEAVQSGTRPTLTWRQRPVPWDLADYEHAMKHLETAYVTNPRVRVPDNDGMWGAAKGWAFGSLLLLAALLILRATDRCLTRGYFRSRRRQSQEWPTPSVLATSQRPDEIISIPNMLDGLTSDSSSNSERQGDPPPPYSACAPHKNEEPPPPYSACYVAYPKDGQSSVVLYDGQRQVFETTTISQESDRQQSSAVGGNQNAELSSCEVTVDIPDGSNPRTSRLAPIASEDSSINSSEGVVTVV